MKYVIFVLVFIMSGCSSICNGGWTTKDSVFEFADQGIIAADWHQTQQIVEEPGYYEYNPVLGRHPSMEKVNIVMASWAIVHMGISCVLKSTWRTTWQISTVVWELPLDVIHNHNNGLHP
jgi:hypothetical protein